MKRNRYIALGLMSGTSIDGVDAAFIETDGEALFRTGPSSFHAYSESDRETLSSATQAALRWKFHGPRPNSSVSAEAVISRTHIRAVKQLCDANPDWAKDLAMIGFHGQTLIHMPPSGASKGKTLQIGNGELLAEKTGFPVYYDFRSADVAAGGQGAPLAPIYHQALVANQKVELPAAVLNIGGVANVTLVTSKNHIIASDTGPGNGPLDNWMEQNGLGAFDADGRLASKGTPNFHIVKQWLDREFFQKVIPKSADRYDFHVINDLDELSVEDGAATLAAFTALSSIYTLQAMHETPKTLIVCGGGRHNKAMLWMLAEHSSAKVLTADAVGWNSDAIEAQAFAYLAVRSKLRMPISFPMTTGVAKPMTGGRLALP